MKFGASLVGQEKNKKRELESFRNSLSESEKVVFELSQKVFELIILRMNMTGGCYRITFLLKALLEKEYGLKSDAIVGFINDGTDEVMVSHAWLEFNGLKVDVTLAKVEPGLNRGPLQILDRRFHEHGTLTYSYHKARGKKADALIERLLAPDFTHHVMIAGKEREHEAMRAISGSVHQIVDFLNKAPDGYTYDWYREHLGYVS